MAHIHTKKEQVLDPSNPEWIKRQAPSGKLFYLETPAEMHRRLVWGRCRCSFCGAQPVTAELKVWYPSDELAKRDPTGFAAGAYPVDRMLDVAKNGVPYHRAAPMWSCGKCKKALAQVAGRTPSWARVIIDSGPSEDAMKSIVQVL